MFCPAKAIQFRSPDNPPFLIMDATFGTNRYGLPLVHVVGMTPQRHPYTHSLALVNGQTTEDFTWVLETLKSRGVNCNLWMVDAEIAESNAIRAVFPEAQIIICRWHLMQAFECSVHTAQCIPDDTMFKEIQGEFRAMIDATYVSDFERLWSLFQRKWMKVNGGAEAIHYINKTWLSHRRRSVCRAYFPHAMHFDILSTSAAESLHRFLKTWLGRWKRTYATIVTAFLRLMIASFRRFQDILAEESKTASHLPLRLPVSLASLSSIVCWTASDLSINHYNKLKNLGQLNKPCTGSFRRTMGCPCAHEVNAMMQDGGAFYPTDFHSFWYWSEPSVQQLARESTYQPWRCITEPPLHPRGLPPLEDGLIPQVDAGDPGEPTGPELEPTRELHFAPPSSTDPLRDMGVLDHLPTGNVALGAELNNPSPIPSNSINAAYTPLDGTELNAPEVDPNQHAHAGAEINAESSNKTGPFLSPKRRRIGQAKDRSKRAKANHHAHGSDAPAASTGRLLSRNEAARKKRAASKRKCGRCRQPGHKRTNPICPGTPPVEVAHVPLDPTPDLGEQDSEHGSAPEPAQDTRFLEETAQGALDITGVGNSPRCVSPHRLTMSLSHPSATQEPIRRFRMPSPLGIPEGPPLPILDLPELRPQTPPPDLAVLRDRLAEAFPNRAMHRNRIEVAIADYEVDQAQWYAEQGTSKRLSDAQYRKRRGLYYWPLTRAAMIRAGWPTADRALLDDLPTRRRNATGEIVNHGPVSWTDSEKRIWLDRVKGGDDADDDRYYEGLEEFGFVPLANRTAAEKRRWGGSAINDGMLFRAVRAREMHNSTLFITDLDDWTSRKIQEKFGAEREQLFRETLHFNQDRWRHYVREGVFPDIPGESGDEESVQDCIIVEGSS